VINCDPIPVFWLSTRTGASYSDRHKYEQDFGMTSIYRKFAVAAASAALSFGTIDANSAQAASLYSITDLGSLAGATYSYGSSINNLGQVVFNTGQGTTNGSSVRGFLESNGQLVPINPLPGDTDISVTDINNLGQVLGNSVNEYTFAGVRPVVYSGTTAQTLGISDGIAYAINDSGQVVGGAQGIGPFLYSNGTVIDLGDESTVAYGINNPGQVVGILNVNRAFLYENGVMTNLGTLPGDNYSSAEDINDLGQVVGVSAPTGVNDGTAFLYSSTTGMMSLGRLLSTDTYSVALGINNAGQVVGWSGTNPNFYSTSGNGVRAFLYSDGVMQDLNGLIAPGSGFVLTQARAINDRGEIVGAGSINGELHAVLLTPSQEIPEPTSTLGVLLFSALSAGWRLKRKL
jgi:probable HAF family extracellular repeat protein